MLPHDPTIDPLALEELCRSLGGREGLPVIARLYQQTAARHLADLERALAMEDGPVVLRLAHSIKSSSRYVGATHVAQACEEAEAAAGRADLDAVRAQLSSLRAHVTRASTALDEEAIR